MNWLACKGLIQFDYFIFIFLNKDVKQICGKINLKLIFL